MAQEKETKNAQAADTAEGEKASVDGEKYTGNTKEEKWYNPKDIDAYDIESYIEKRWGDQFGYFEKRSGYNRDWYNRIQFLIIFFGALSVVILSFNLDELFAKLFPCMANLHVTNVICALMSGTIVVLTGYDKLKQFNSEWTNKRKAQENLKTELCKFKFGVEPYEYAGPQVETVKKENGEKPEVQKAEGEEKKVDTKVTSARTKHLLVSLNDIARKYDDTSFDNSYKEIRNQISDYLSSSNEYAEIDGAISDKDKIFVKRIDAIVENSKQIIESASLFRAIKDEMSDFYTDGGAYKVEPTAKPQKKDSRDEIVAKNERLFVARIEAIVAQDVGEFVTAKTKNSAQKKDDDKEDDKK